MTTKGRARLNVGLIGVGRLGRVYARDLATRIPSTRLTAVADVAEDLAAEVAPTAVQHATGSFAVARR